MKLDLINMSKVPTAETVGESDKVLIESGGEIKKTAASNIGGGGSSPVVVLGIDETTGAFDKTWSEILALVTAGKLVCQIISTENMSASLMIVAEVVTYDDGGTDKWRVSFLDLANPETMYNAYADSASGYPVLDD